jgi:UDP-glucuronate 4-epimerase
LEKTKKILVTGAAGFIGFHLCKRLVNLGYSVLGIDNINDYYDVNLKYARLSEMGIKRSFAELFFKEVSSSAFKNPFRFVRMNLEDREELSQLFEKEQFNVVCNLAAQAGVRYSLENPQAYIDSNIQGFMNILENCRHYQVKKLVYASSSSVYGNAKSVPFKETDNVDHPISLYAATKKSNELMAYTYSHLYNIQTIGLRFFTVYGPWGRPDMAMFLFTDAIINDKPIKVFNNGDLARDFTYIDDIIDGVISTLDKDSKSNQPYQLYNIGNNSPVKLLDFIEQLETCIGKKAEKIMMPMQDGDVYMTYADTTSLNTEFSYESKTNVAHGIKEFVNWYQKYNA